MSEDLTCQRLTDLIEGYLSGSLDPERRDRFEAHLAECPACVRYLASYAATVRAARRLRAATPPVPPALIQAILSARVTAAPRRHPSR